MTLNLCKTNEGRLQFFFPISVIVKRYKSSLFLSKFHLLDVTASPWHPNQMAHRYDMAYSYSKILLSVHMNIVLNTTRYQKRASKTIQTARFPKEQCRPSAILKNNPLTVTKENLYRFRILRHSSTCPMSMAFAKSSHASPVDVKC